MTRATPRQAELLQAIDSLRKELGRDPHPREVRHRFTGSLEGTLATARQSGLVTPGKRGSVHCVLTLTPRGRQALESEARRLAPTPKPSARPRATGVRAQSPPPPPPMLIATLLALLALVCITVELTASCYPVRAEWRNGYGVVWMVDGGVQYLAAGRHSWPPSRVVDARGNVYEPAVVGFYATESEVAVAASPGSQRGNYEVKR